MVRTLISLPEKDKAWLDKKAKAKGLPMTALVQEAVRLYRRTDAEKAETPTFDELLQRVRGTWKNGDGLAWQKKMRAEWDR